MGGLIPLLLPSSTTNRSSVLISPPGAKRPASVMASHGPVVLGHHRQYSLPLIKPTKRLSISPPAITRDLPETAKDWRMAINEVKRKYVSRKYRTCSARCCEILDSVRESSNVETLHLVYLHVYAALSSEMCALPLSQSSAYRTKLLDDAREHYDKASALIKKAEEAAIEKTRSASSDSASPSLDSPSRSGSSSSSSVCTTPSSPRNSFSSVEDLKARKQIAKPKKKKKVSFSGLPEIEIPKNNWQPEPYIRPDSPTLGWEADYSLFGQSGFPTDPVMAHPTPKAAETITSKPMEQTKSQISPSPVLKPVPEENQIEDAFDLEAFLQTRSMNRIIAQLSALRSQVAWHRDNIDTLMTESDEIPEVPGTPIMPDVPCEPGLTHSGSSSSSASTSDTEEQLSPPGSAALTPRTLEKALSQQFKDSFGNNSSFDLTARMSLFGGHPEAWDRSRSGSVCSTTSSSVLPPRSASQLSMRSNGDEALQKRIERLRSNGWQRKRFDSRRYEVLREQVLSELKT
ncbi:hypothetical protein SCUP234_00787 [Seiridium cupressi]